MKYRSRRLWHVSHPSAAPQPHQHRGNLSPHQLIQRLRSVKLLVCDVDGVLTDGKVLISEKGESKQFCIQDGLAMRLCRLAGLKVAWVSARPSPATDKRAKELKIDFVIQTQTSKVSVVQDILEQLQLSWNSTAFIGDDIVDLAAMNKARLAVAPANACLEVKTSAHFVTEHFGGEGAVREMVEKILKSQGKWDKIIKDFGR